MAWQIHRFRDVAAISTGTGETVYLTEKEARRLARALNAVARSIKREGFGASRGLTVAGETLPRERDRTRPLPAMRRTAEGLALGYDD